DIPWLHFHPIRRLLFYNYPCSNAHFFETIVPELKQSLSLTLKHYLPLSGKLIYPLNTNEKPVFRYEPGDSVSLTVAVSSHDFDELVGNQARDAEYQAVPVLALQATLFPDHGICIGFANHHTVGDASSIFRFMKTWSSITKLGENDSSLPVFDRSFIKDPIGIDTIYWKVMGEIPLKSSSFPLPTNRVRTTFTLRSDDIKRLKDMVLAEKPGLVQVSSFVVTVSYVWACLVKSGEVVDSDVLEFLIFAADVRGRVDPPVLENYFGNCLAAGMAKMEHSRLVGEEGFVSVAEVIAEDIKNRVNKKGEALKGAENWMSDMKKFKGMRGVGVAGSPKFDLCDADFGWGRARKLEIVSIDGESYSMSLCKCSDSDGGLEVGLSLPKERMEAFGAIFAEGLSA
ncbi:malonyl-coenzyme:anthocyanin 5-o-glucoside-6'''-o-malonyltransferase, partial [Phtheirospermum japonicum]